MCRGLGRRELGRDRDTLSLSGSDQRSVLTEGAVRNPLGFLLDSLVLKEAWESWAGEVEESRVCSSSLGHSWLARGL